MNWGDIVVVLNVTADLGSIILCGTVLFIVISLYLRKRFNLKKFRKQ